MTAREVQIQIANTWIKLTTVLFHKLLQIMKLLINNKVRVSPRQEYKLCMGLARDSGHNIKNVGLMSMSF